MAEGSESFDLVILGAGNGGYSAAFRAVGLGLKVAMVEKDKVGGTCLHRGCIPTKALLHAADLVDEIKHAGDFGVLVQEPSVDWGKVLNFKDSVVGRMYKGLSGLVAKKKIELVEGEGRLLDAKTVVVNTKEGERTLTGEKGVLIATGSYPRDLPFIKADGDKVHNSNHGLTAGDIPSSVIVVGGNYIGLEFASIYRSLGAEVQVVEMLPKIAPAEDSDISEALNKLLQKRGIKFHLGVSVSGATPTDSGIEVQIEKDGTKETLTADRMFVAIGRGPRTEGIGLEEAGVKVDKGYIVVDQGFRTSVQGVYAIGDAVFIPDANWPHPQLAHVAFIEGIKVAERIAGEEPAPVDYKNIPHIIYCQPEVAAVGLTEDKAKELGMEVQTSRYPFSANARALMLGGGQGFVKTVAEKGGAVVGVHIVGPRASDIITEAQLVTSWEAYPSELAELIHPHPTLSEALGETFLGLVGKPLHG
ncbi:MAG: dihydrolipoamide dehydrogenase [Actinomycetota bacterium]|jgi:dihydrolipoamide dehydrogenase|nr:dihydrolipoamide dehydrogenase [Actinomycetota bacterium]